MTTTSTLYASSTELAKLLGVSTRTIWDWTRHSKIPAPRRVGIKNMHHVQSVVHAAQVNGLDFDPSIIRVLELQQ